MCEAFAKAGMEVELVVPRQRNHINDDPFIYYHVGKSFVISRVSSLDLVSFGRIGFLMQSLTFSLAVLWRVYSEVKKRNEIVFYSRDEMLAYLLSLFGMKVVWEAHMGHNNFFIRSLIRRNVPIVSISCGLGDLYRSYGAKKVLISPDGVDLEQFQIGESRDEARVKLGLPKEIKLVIYTGHLYLWKGADTLAEAAVKLGNNTDVIFVGGTKKDVEFFRNKYGGVKNLMILGNISHNEIPMYLRAADVLVIPNSAKEKISSMYTSPMKLFEYMASGTPIVASDLPSIREVLNERSAAFFIPDDAESLASVIIDLLQDPSRRARLSSQILSDIIRFSWDHRANGIISFMHND